MYAVSCSCMRSNRSSGLPPLVAPSRAQPGGPVSLPQSPQSSDRDKSTMTRNMRRVPAINTRTQTQTQTSAVAETSAPTLGPLSLATPCVSAVDGERVTGASAGKWPECSRKWLRLACPRAGSARSLEYRRGPNAGLPFRNVNGTFLRAAIRHNTNLQKFEFCLALEWWL